MAAIDMQFLEKGMYAGVCLAWMRGTGMPAGHQADNGKMRYMSRADLNCRFMAV